MWAWKRGHVSAFRPTPPTRRCSLQVPWRARLFSSREGAGAVGHYAIQLAKRRRAIVLATASSSAKADIARQAGADYVIDYKRERVGERTKAITAGRGVDAV